MESKNGIKEKLLEQKRQIVTEIQSKLQELREEGQGLSRIARMSCSCNGESDDVENFDPELTARLIEIRNTELRQVEMALERLEQDEYGLCVDCGEDISQKRLIAMPFAVRCKDCEEKTEQNPKSA